MSHLTHLARRLRQEWLECKNMSDERYLLPERSKPGPIAPRPHPESRRLAVLALIVSLLSAVISLISVTFTGWQAYQGRKIAERGQGPFIEIIGAEFINQNNLRIKYRNNGKTTAYHLHNLPEAHYCLWAFNPLRTKSSMNTVFVDKLGDLGHPDAPVGKELESYAYLRDPASLRHFFHFEYQENMVIQLRGRFRYEDGRHNVYYTPWCYQTSQPYKTAKPGWSACYDLE